MTKEKVHLKDIKEDVQNREEKIIIVGDKKYWADRTNKDNYATHDDCNTCNKEFEKRFTHQRKCNDCLWKENNERFLSLPLKEWNGDTPLVIYKDDQFFFDSDDLLFYCEENNITPEELQLCLCKQPKLSPIDYSYWEDVLHEDWEPSEEFKKHIENFNKFLEKEPTNSWFQDKYRVQVTSEDINYKPE